MKKKLIRFESGKFAELDPIRLKRKALSLRDEIMEKIPKDNDPYCFHQKTLPLVDAAIRGEIIEPVEQDASKFISANYKWDEREGTLPPEYDSKFSSALAGFSVTIRGLSLEKTDDIIIDGLTYRWVDFEEDGDWPSNVKFP